MNDAEYTKIIKLYESHLQVKKIINTRTIRLYIYSVDIFFKFCKKYYKDLILPLNWEIENIGVRELEAFLKYQNNHLKWKRSTLVTCLSGIKSFMNFLSEINYLDRNPIQNFKLPRNINEIGEQRFQIVDIENLFKFSNKNSLIEIQQILLLEFIYGLGMSLSKITNIKTIVPELDAGTVRIYFKDSKYLDYPLNKSAIDMLKSYLKKIDSIEGDNSFWVNNKGKIMNAGQLQNLLNKYFESNNLPQINAGELRDLSVKHFSEKGADIRSIQTLRKTKKIRRLQSLSDTDFNHLKDIIKQKHIRNK